MLMRVFQIVTGTVGQHVFVCVFITLGFRHHIAGCKDSLGGFHARAARSPLQEPTIVVTRHDFDALFAIKQFTTHRIVNHTRNSTLDKI